MSVVLFNLNIVFEVPDKLNDDFVACGRLQLF